MRTLLLMLAVVITAAECAAFDWKPATVMFYPGVARYSADYEESQESTSMSVGVGVTWKLSQGFFAGVNTRYIYIENLTYPFGFGNGWVKKKRYMMYVPFRIGYACDLEETKPFVYLSPTLCYKLSARTVSFIKPIADDPIYNTGFYADTPLLMEDGGYGLGFGGGLSFQATRRFVWEVDISYHYGLRPFVGTTDEPGGGRARDQGFSLMIGFGYVIH